MMEGPCADSEEKHEPVSGVDIAVAVSPKVLDLDGRLEKRTWPTPTVISSFEPEPTCRLQIGVASITAESTAQSCPSHPGKADMRRSLSAMPVFAERTSGAQQRSESWKRPDQRNNISIASRNIMS
jgi:hypothetical protein